MNHGIEVTREKGIATVRLPEGGQALAYAQFAELKRLAEVFQQDRHLRALILCGDEQGFSCGLADQLNQAQSNALLQEQADSSLLQDVSLLWKALPVPVIVAINGCCFGVAMQLALCGDIRIASSGSQFSITESDGQLLPMGLSSVVQELVRIDLLKKWTMTGEVLSVEQAMQMGLLTESCEGDAGDVAQALAERLLSRSPDSMAAAKQLYEVTRHSDDRETLRWERKLQSKLFLRWNMMAASSQNLSKNPLQYKKRKVS